VWAYEQGYGSIVLQSGERIDSDFVDLIERLLGDIKKRTEGKLGITLSLGEQSYETFKRWFLAGAHRYLLRIETSNEELYGKLHPRESTYKDRLQCLDLLRKIGYQVGTGVMIGLPFQTCEDLADDILFFEKQDIDMIGMGPYIVHKDTPLAFKENNTADHNFILGLKMIALTRIYLKDVNIAATTALQALDPIGREKGLQAGANIIMPNITPVEHRGNYLLYEEKPCLDENASMCRNCLENRISSIGEKVGFGQWGDSPHFFKRVASKTNL
jgi:biotin synthase